MLEDALLDGSLSGGAKVTGGVVVPDKWSYYRRHNKFTMKSTLRGSPHTWTTRKLLQCSKDSSTTIWMDPQPSTNVL